MQFTFTMKKIVIFEWCARDVQNKVEWDMSYVQYLLIFFVHKGLECAYNYGC